MLLRSQRSHGRCGRGGEAAGLKPRVDDSGRAEREGCDLCREIRVSRARYELKLAPAHGRSNYVELASALEL